MGTQATWIWFPGDFEMMLNLNVHSARYERGMQVTPIWRLDSFYENVKFRKTFVLSEETTIYIESEGQTAVEVDRLGNYIYDYQNGLHLPKGEHFIVITVFNRNSIPTIFIDSPQLKTDETWQVTCVDGIWHQAERWSFNKKETPPTKFPFETTDIEAVRVEKMQNGILYDFGKELMGYLRFQGVYGSGMCQISYGESREEALDYEHSEVIDSFDSMADGFVSPRSKAYRYVYLRTTDDLQVDKITAIYEYLPIKNRGNFTCNDSLINDIYDVSLHTLHLNSREFFFDGIKRDRWVWGGDACQSYMLNYYSFFDKDICKRTMRVLRGKNVIATHHNTIQDYTCYWFIALYDYYLYTGDKEFIVNIYQNAKGLMDFCLNKMDDRGFMKADPQDWVFIDWAPIDNSRDVSTIQILFARSLQTMALLAEINHDAQGQEYYNAAYQKTLTNCFRYFWSNKYNCFTHGLAEEPDAVVTKYPNMFALLFGYLNDEQRESAKINTLLNENVLKITTPYMRFYELMSLSEIGCLEQVTMFLKEYWGGMLNLGATSFWEEYNPEKSGVEHYEMYGRRYGKSLCHAWGAGPILLFGRYYLGVRPASFGYKTFVVSPHLGGLGVVEGSVPTPDGDIYVRYDGETLKVINHTPFEGVIRINDIQRQIGSNETVLLSDLSDKGV